MPNQFFNTVLTMSRITRRINKKTQMDVQGSQIYGTSLDAPSSEPIVSFHSPLDRLQIAVGQAIASEGRDGSLPTE